MILFVPNATAYRMCVRN